MVDGWPGLPSDDVALSMRRQFLDAIVLHKLAMQGIVLPEGCFDEDTDRLIYGRIPGHDQGPVSAMVENALPLVDRLAGIVAGRLT